jgi:hypothetical protein
MKASRTAVAREGDTTFSWSGKKIFGTVRTIKFSMTGIVFKGGGKLSNFFLPSKIQRIALVAVHMPSIGLSFTFSSENYLTRQGHRIVALYYYAHSKRYE